VSICNIHVAIILMSLSKYRSGGRLLPKITKEFEMTSLNVKESLVFASFSNFR
jgi:hypothetical protein